jgi:hypothetical protein
MFAAKGIEVPMSLALETVAKVEGYNDWNAMSQLVPNAKDKSAKKAAEVAPAVPPVVEDEGPFVIRINGRYYETVESFSHTEVRSYGQQVSITNKAGKTVASYIDPECRFRIFECSRVDYQVLERDNHELYIEENWDSDWTLATRDDVLNLCRQLAREAIKDEENVLVGVQEFICDENGRIDNETPPIPTFFYTWGKELTVPLGAPEDLRQALSFYLKK